MKQDMQNWMRLAIKQSLRSKCLRAKRGTIAVKNNQVIASGYNKIFPDDDSCQKQGCFRDQFNLQLGFALEKCRSIHAEVMLISKAARKGVNLENCEIYTTSLPCIICAKSLVSAGVKKVFYLDKYGDDEGEKLLKEIGVLVSRVVLENDNKNERLRDIEKQE